MLSCGQDPQDESQLVVYCAHDAVYAEPVLREFEKQSGIRLSIRFDTEATKSLGLVELIADERGHPQCDVFWNNEVLGMLRLKELNLLQRHESPATGRFSEKFRDPDQQWHGFAGRMRVWIFNTERMGTDGAGIEDRLKSPDYSRIAIARPLFGTTRSHYTVLWETFGAEGLQQWHRLWHDRKAVEAAGNAAVKNLVAAGTCDFGLTDTDDYFSARDQGKPVAKQIFHLPDGRVILIPNTVAMLASSGRKSAAGKLIDYLLSEEVELALARSGARQIPLGPVSESMLPEEVRDLHAEISQAYIFQNASESAAACLDWLKKEYLP